MSLRVKVLYFASLRDASGCAAQDVETDASNVAALYAEVRSRHGFALPAERLRAAIDGEFVAWDAPLRDGAEVAFLPPVSGG
jgi:molybdopterin synthase sulfur carrier subunit